MEHHPPTKRFGHRNQTGFTIVELLTCISIIAILGAILVPVLGSVRQSAKIASSISNLRQLGIAAVIYSSENNGDLVPHAIFDPVLGENREWCYALWQSGVENALANGILGPYLEDAEKVLRCPIWEASEQTQKMMDAAGKPGLLGYGYNGLNLSEMIDEPNGHYRGYPRAVLANPSETIMFATSAQPFGGEAGPQEMIWGPDHIIKQPCVRRVNESEAIVCWADGSVSMVNAIPQRTMDDDGVVLGQLDKDMDGRADEEIWHVRR